MALAQGKDEIKTGSEKTSWSRINEMGVIMWIYGLALDSTPLDSTLVPILFLYNLGFSFEIG